MVITMERDVYVRRLQRYGRAFYIALPKNIVERFGKQVILIVREVDDDRVVIEIKSVRSLR